MCQTVYRKMRAIVAKTGSQKNISKTCGTTYPKKHCERAERMFQNGTKIVSQKTAGMVSKKTPKQCKNDTEIVPQKRHKTGFP